MKRNMRLLAIATILFFSWTSVAAFGSEIKMKCGDNYYKWLSVNKKIQTRRDGNWVTWCNTTKKKPSWENLEFQLGDEGGYCLSWDGNKNVFRGTVLDFEFLELTQGYWRKEEKKPEEPQFKFSCYLK